jgi:hypothetical protein
MEKRFLRAVVQRDEAGNGKAGEPIRFVASTEGLKRDGIDLKANDWFLDNFRKNPVFLWAHDYMGRNLPLGRVDAQISGNKLISDVVFDQDDDFAKQVERKYRAGFLHTVSVGWDFIEIDKRRRMDLLDISGVPVPGDPDALIQRAYDTLKELVDPAANSDDEEDWAEVSAAMVGVFDRFSDDSDEGRQRIYKSLLPKYRRLGKTAPEFRTLEELKVLEDEDIAALFFESEFSKPRKRVIQNKTNLEEAIRLIQEVLNEEDEPEETPEEEEEPAGSDEPDMESLERIAKGIDLYLKTRSLS